MTTDDAGVVFHLKLTAEDLADWLDYCREHGYDPHVRVREVLMLEVYR